MYKSLNQHIRSARTGKNTVALVGFAMTTRDLAPWDDPDTEIWGLNEAYLQEFMKRWDRWFQLHPEDNFNRKDNHNDPDHPKWLRESHNKPIYLQKKYKYIPDAVKYPLDEVMSQVSDYLTSSFSFMISLAMLEGFERIEIYGFEMGTHTEYHYQKAGAEYLIGMARGMGIEVYMPENSTLCKGQMYGYETMDVPFRQSLEYRQSGIEDEIPALRDLAMIEKGKLARLEEDIKLTDFDERLVSQRTDQEHAMDMAAGKHNFMQGALHENREAIKLYDKFLVNSGVIPSQDFTTHEENNDKA